MFFAVVFLVVAVFLWVSVEVQRGVDDTDPKYTDYDEHGFKKF